MSIDSNSQCVRSKYFCQPDMDESLSDFQETKPSCKGPKQAQKPNKPKTRKITKRIKGQKDIRSALKGKKNDLVSYTEEFNTVCKKSGLDVDSEQLQLAIALSKSLQTESSSSESSQPLSSQHRVAKIRKTLQEYGFKVPEAKVTVTKRTKKHIKQYKLLTSSEEDKQQDISYKYSQILFKNIDTLRLDQNSSEEVIARVFNIATNITYECMKDNNVFYVEDLIEKSTTNGSLLRDWSEIPGRPESPKLVDPIIMNIKDIDCSQDELDVILSGPIKCVKDIIASKPIVCNKYKECDVPKIIIEDEGSEEIGIKVNNHELSSDNDILSTNDTKNELPCEATTLDNILKSPAKELIDEKSPVSEVIEIKSPVKGKTIKTKPREEAIHVEVTNKLTYTQYRSCSPDIFDDELSSIMDNTKPQNVLSQEYKTKLFTEDNFMDLTQCANFPSQNSQKSIQLSQNVTKRRSNDYMEITECIVGSSQPIREEFREIDLTQSPEENNAVLEEIFSKDVGNNVESVTPNLSSNEVHKNSNNSISQNVTDERNVTVILNLEGNVDSSQTDKDNIDLTQSSNEDGKAIAVLEENNETPNKIVHESMDLTQSSNSDDTDDLPLVNVGNSQSLSLDNTIILNEEGYIANGKVKKSMVFENEVHSEIFDLTQAQVNSLEYNSSPTKNNTQSCSNSFYQDFVHDHSENTENSKEIEENTDQSIDNNSFPNKTKESDNIDLTQGSDMSEERLVSPKPITVLPNVPNNSSLGKRDDDVSIDYDEIINDDNTCDKENFKETVNDNSYNSKNDSSKSEANNDIEIVEENNDLHFNSSQNSEVFNISDKELDYSLHKSRHDFPKDNFDFGGISVLDNVTGLESFRKSLSGGNQSIKNNKVSMRDSCLPEVNIKRTDETGTSAGTVKHKTEAISPIKVESVSTSNNGVINVRTPKNTEYIIKTDNVTPMADYASMSTPQRNRELDRYGLKPFKRKRAIQILTHLYNQTHPTIEQLLDEEQHSPSKKRRQDTLYTSPKKITSPKNSPAKRNGPYVNGIILNAIQNSSKSSPIKKQLHETGKLASPRKTELERDGNILSGPSFKAKETTDICGYELSSEIPVISKTDCSPEDWVFQKKEKAKVHSCRVPLHIAFHNYVMSRRSLREAILKYEPVNIDVIHKDLVGYGHRYDPKDLLKFLDKKCITVKTTDNNSRNNKR